MNGSLATTAMVWTLAVLAPAARAGGPEPIVLADQLSAGLVVSDELEASPPAYRVRWIKWDSGFRGSGLEVGDRILAVNGKRLEVPPTRKERQQIHDRAIGHMFEAQGWVAAGLKDGSPVTLTVVRRAMPRGTRTLDVKGAIRAERRYKDASGRPHFGPGGPSGWDREAGDSWDAWYGRLVERWQQALDGGWQRSSFSNRYELDQIVADAPRFKLLFEKYPGPFATAVKEDRDRLLAHVAGKQYELRDADLVYRRAVEDRIAAVAAAGVKAREAFLAAHAAARIEPFPAADPMTGNPALVKGKVVVLPMLTNRDLVMEAGRCFFIAGDGKKGWYFVDCAMPGTRRMFDAVARYHRQVTPELSNSYALIARVTGEPGMLTIQGKATVGHKVELVAATIGERVFVDLTATSGKESRFAGEAELVRAGDKPLTATASPVEVMEAFVRELKAGREEAWRELFATWRAERRTGYAAYLPNVPLPRTFARAWIDSRALILDRVYDARVAWVSEVEKLLTGKEFKGAPVVEQVTVELDHVGRFAGEYRSFATVAVHRMWVLQRVDGGPWRIASVQGL
jgi:hypothetical protein